ncbi:MAG: hypothetical protein HOE69_06305, partial [Euryarchaeota archaeon]|nr:hypothetical protein [Euryarchaeota archaeon]
MARKFDSQAVAEILAKWNGLPSNANGKIGVSQLADEYGCSRRTIQNIGKGKYLKRKNSISMKGKTLSDFP